MARIYSKHDHLGRYDITVSWVKILMVYASWIKIERGAVHSEALPAAQSGY